MGGLLDDGDDKNTHSLYLSLSVKDMGNVVAVDDTHYDTVKRRP
jgi:hypothetical protein